jgi:transcriptional regulator with XRE-family HTH domain
LVVKKSARGLGKRIRQLRGDAGITQEELAEKVGVHPTYIAKIEGGSRLPSLELLYAIAGAVHAAASDLLLDEIAPSNDVQDQVISEVTAYLRHCGPRQRLVVRDFVMMMKRHFSTEE